MSCFLIARPHKAVHSCTVRWYFHQGSASVSISQSVVLVKLSVAVGVLITQSLADEWLIEMFRSTDFLMFPVFTPTFRLSFPTYLAQWFPPHSPREQVEVFNLLPIWASPSTTAEPTNCTRTVIELSVGPSQTIKVIRSQRRTAWQPALLCLITAAGGRPD